MGTCGPLEPVYTSGLLNFPNRVQYLPVPILHRAIFRIGLSGFNECRCAGLLCTPFGILGQLWVGSAGSPN